MPLSGLSICAVADRVVVQRGREPLAGRVRPVPARVRGRPGRRLAERDRAQARGAQGRGERTGSTAASRSRKPTRTLRSQAYARSDQRSIRRCVDAHINRGRLLHEAGRFEEAEQAYRAAHHGLRQRAAAALQPRRAAGRHGPQGRGDRSLRRRRCARTPASPIATTTSRCSARSSACRARRSGTWPSTASSPGRGPNDRSEGKKGDAMA